MNRPKIGVVVEVPLREKLFSAEDMARLEALGDVVWTDRTGKLTDDEMIGVLKDCDIAVASWHDTGLSAKILDACPRLRLWEYAAGSVKHMFGPHLKGRGIVIASCAPANAENVAEHTLGLLILGLKRVFENAADNRRGLTPKPPNVRVLASSTIGLVGASQIGRRVIRMLQPFEPTVLLYDPYVSADEAAALGVRKVDDLLELCAASHAVSIHAPSLPSTRHMFSTAQFQAMADDAVVINTARGALIDEAALVAELEKGRLFAYLDVTDPEPAPDDSPLRRLPNVVLTSHIAGIADRKFGRQAVDDVERFLRGESPLMVVTADMLDRLA